MSNRQKKTIQSWALFLPEINEFLKTKQYDSLKELLDTLHPVDIADTWDKLEEKDKLIVFKLLKPIKSVEVFEEIEVSDQRYLLEKLDAEKAGSILDELPSDVKAKVFWKLSNKLYKKFTSLMRSEEVDKVKKALKYPKGSAGFLMNTDFIDLKPEMSIKQALERIQYFSRSRRIENLYAFYVTQGTGELLGGLTLRRIVALPANSNVGESMSAVGVITLTADMSENEVANIFSKYNLTCAPVVDSENVLVGIITVDDIIDVLEDEATEDIQKGASVVPLGMGYNTASVWTLYWKRIPWLALLTAISLLSVGIISAFSEILEAIVALAFFIPVVIHTGGKAGTQAATLVVRAIATGDLNLKKWFSVVEKELQAGTLLGGTLGAILFLFSYLWLDDFRISLVIGMSVIVNVLWATITGGLLPIILTKLKLDPAVISSPLITTMVDVIGVLIYFSIAVWWLKL